MLDFVKKNLLEGLFMALSVAATGYSMISRARMIPPVVTFAASTLGIALALIYTSEYFTIPFGCSGVSSIYLGYLAHEYRHLKDFETNNLQYRQENIILRETNVLLRENVVHLSFEIQKFTLENGRLAILITTLDERIKELTVGNTKFLETIGSLRQTNGSLVETQNKLKQDVEQLNSLNTTLDQSRMAYRAQLDRLSQLNETLSKMKDDSVGSFREVITTLSKHLEGFSAENEILAKMRDATTKDHEQATKTASLLSGILEKVNAWQEDSSHSKQIEKIEALMKLQNAMQMELGAAKAEKEKLSADISRLEKVREALEKGILDFQGQNLQLTVGVTELRTLIHKAVGVANGRL